MSAPLETQLERAQKRAEIARLKRQETADKLLQKRLTALDKYDATDPRYQTQRRRVTRETRGEDDVQTGAEFSRGIAVGRDLRRNNGAYKTLETQLCTLTVGCGPRLLVNVPDKGDAQAVEWGERAADWFNSIYSKTCDGRDDSPLADMVWNALGAAVREGDILCVFDDFDEDDGCLHWYEADQLVEVIDKEWEDASKTRGWIWKTEDPEDRRRRIPMRQDHGVIRDIRGKVHGYIVMADRLKRGQLKANLSRTTQIPAWHPRRNPAGSAKLFKAPWRNTYYRGIGDVLSVSNQLQDIYEMLAAELQSGKKAAQWLLAVTTDGEGASGIERAMLRAGVTQSKMDEILYGDGDSTNNTASTTNYDGLEGTFGGNMEYFDPGDKPEFIQTERPNEKVTDFGERVMVRSGASMGLGRARSTMTASTAYTAFRGEELMSWQTAEIWQKRLERRLMDFIGYKAIAHAIRRKGLPAPPASAEMWPNMIGWQWPEMREVDEEKTANARRIHTKNGEPLSRYLGPHWKRKLEAYAEIVDFAREKELPLAMFESISGAELKDEE